MSLKERIQKILDNDFKNILMIIFLMFSLFILLHDVCESSIIGRSGWDSYEIQAESWLNGRLDVDYLSYLELADYEGKWYVSFPPLPSVIMVPLLMIFGAGRIPNNLIMFITATLCVILTYKILRRYKTNETNSLLVAFGMVIGSNMLSMSLNGGVWFVAQQFNMFFCLLAVNSLTKNKRASTYFFLALAVGCRPFSALYLIASYLYFTFKDRKKGFFKSIFRSIPALIPMILVASFYMVLNSARFGNPIEFGHNYLPEFTRIEEGNYGQFSVKYLWNNLKDLFQFRIKFDEKLNLSFVYPFMLFIANPLFLVGILDSLKKLIKFKRISFYRFLFVLAMVLNIILLCMHKTLGGWQFGARYTCDLLPFVLLLLMLQNKITDTKFGRIISMDDSINSVNLDKLQITCILFGIILNIVGTIEFWRNIL